MIDWKTVPLKELVKFKNGLNYDASNVGTGIKIIGVGNFQGRTSPDYNSLKELAGLENISSDYFLAHNDLLFVRSNGNPELVGSVLFVVNPPARVTHSGFTIRARVVSPAVMPGYLALFVTSRHFRQALARQNGGTNITNLSQETLSSTTVLVPPMNVQQHIVEVLDNADAAVRTMDALILAKERHKAAVAEKLLTGAMRYPEFARQPWREVRLSEMFRERSARHPDPDPVVLSCSKLHGILPQAERFSRILASKDLSRYKFVEAGDLVFDPMLLWDASINFSTLRGIVSPAYCTLQFVGHEKYNPHFLHHLLYTKAMRHQYKLISQGTNVRRKKAPASDFLRISMPFPTSLSEQTKIAECLNLMDEEIRLLKAQRQAQQQLKQGLMQELLSGEKRIGASASSVPA